jgi:hypothetical protein
MSVIDRVSSMTSSQLQQLDEGTRAQVMHIRKKLGLASFTPIAQPTVQQRQQGQQSSQAPHVGGTTPIPVPGHRVLAPASSSVQGKYSGVRNSGMRDPGFSGGGAGRAPSPAARAIPVRNRAPSYEPDDDEYSQLDGI